MFLGHLASNQPTPTPPPKNKNKNKNRIKGKSRGSAPLIRKLPFHQSEPVIGHMVALPRIHDKTGRERGAVHFVLGGVQVGSIPGNVAGGWGGVHNHRGMECQVDVLCS